MRFLTGIIRTLTTTVQKSSEQNIRHLLTNRFPGASVNVVDVSGGCGAMYEVFVETVEFNGLPILKQHKLITETLKEQIKDMHGVRIHTSVPKK